MEKTIALVNLWGDFARKHPGGTIEDFCRHHLAQGQRPERKGPPEGRVPGMIEGLLLKTIARIGRLSASYANLALEGTGLNQIEEFGMMIVIKQQKPTKSEVIYGNIFELSSGTDMLARLKKRGLIKEYDDTEDRRSKRLELTPKGDKILETAGKKVWMNATMLTKSLTVDDKLLCIQLLKSIDMDFSALWPKHRGKKFDEIYKEVMN